MQPGPCEKRRAPSVITCQFRRSNNSTTQPLRQVDHRHFEGLTKVRMPSLQIMCSEQTQICSSFPTAEESRQKSMRSCQSGDSAQHRSSLASKSEWQCSVSSSRKISVSTHRKEWEKRVATSQVVNAWEWSTTRGRKWREEEVQQRIRGSPGRSPTICRVYLEKLSRGSRANRNLNTHFASGLYQIQTPANRRRLDDEDDEWTMTSESCSSRTAGSGHRGLPQRREETHQQRRSTVEA